MLNFVHGNLYSVALELSKKYVAKGLTRPVLNYVRHTKNGRMEATDASRAIIFHEIQGFEREYLIDPKTYNVATGEFPDLNGVFKTNEHELVLSLTKEQIFLWHQLFRSINNTFKTIKVSDRNKMVHLFFKEDHVKVELSGMDVSVNLPAGIVSSDQKPISVNSEYIRDAMEVFKRMDSQLVHVKMKGAFRPIHFEDKGRIEIVVLPIRSYGEIKEEETT